MEPNRFTILEFDLAYLALLTQACTKPLSHWEGLVPNGIDAVIHEMELEFAYVNRRLQDGRSIFKTFCGYYASFAVLGL